MSFKLYHSIDFCQQYNLFVIFRFQTRHPEPPNIFKLYHWLISAIILPLPPQIPKNRHVQQYWMPSCPHLESHIYNSTSLCPYHIPMLPYPQTIPCFLYCYAKLVSLVTYTGTTVHPSICLSYMRRRIFLSSPNKTLLDLHIEVSTMATHLWMHLGRLSSLQDGGRKGKRKWHQ